MLFGQLLHQRALVGAALAQQREDQLLLAVVVGLEERQDVLVVVGHQSQPLGIAVGDPTDELRGRAERVAEDTVHREHVRGVETRRLGLGGGGGRGHGRLLFGNGCDILTRGAGSRLSPTGRRGRVHVPVTSVAHGRDGLAEPVDPIPPELDLTRVPTHVACVMDGNGRWANARGLPRTEGHAAGETALLDVVYGALAIGVKWITLYAFSTENWRRPPDEVRYLMNFNQSLLMRRRDELHANGVQIRFAGRRDWRVPRRVLKRMDESIGLTKDNRRMVMTMAFNYGGRAEIVDAVRAIAAEGIAPNKIDEKTIRRHLYFPDMPDPDLVIRTSGETRISNFLLWELAYSELVFPEILWPDMRRRHLYEAIIDFQRRVRRFGAVNP